MRSNVPTIYQTFSHPLSEKKNVYSRMHCFEIFFSVTHPHIVRSYIFTSRMQGDRSMNALGAKGDETCVSA